jgi:hypothetical protein
MTVINDAFTTGDICNGELIKEKKQRENNSHNETMNAQELTGDS